MISTKLGSSFAKISGLTGILNWLNGFNPSDLDPTAPAVWGKLAVALAGADGGARRRAAARPPELAGTALRGSIWTGLWRERERR